MNSENSSGAWELSLRPWHLEILLSVWIELGTGLTGGDQKMAKRGSKNIHTPGRDGNRERKKQPWALEPGLVILQDDRKQRGS